MTTRLSPCVCGTVLGILGLLVSLSASTSNTCSPTCLAPPESRNNASTACNTTVSTCNETATACNTTVSACNETSPACNTTASACNETATTCNATESTCNNTTSACNGTESTCNGTSSACNGTESACNATSSACDGTQPTCDDPGPSCNLTTLECLYGCQEGFGGDMCQFRCANNCSNCTVTHCDDNCMQDCANTTGNCTANCDPSSVNCTTICDNTTGNCTADCDNTTCSQTEACVSGCREGLYGQNCSLLCPAHCLNSSCDRDNGTCQYGCEGDFFGDTCELSCSPNCAKLSANGADLTCNKTTLACLHGCKGNFEGDMCDRCKRGKIGQQCDIECDYNCQNCILQDGKGECDICLPGYYYFNKDCVQCRSSCLRLNITDDFTCKQKDGTCLYGCVNTYWGSQCEKGCGPLCINRTCNRHDGCCTIDYCKYNTSGGCNCQTPCNKNCDKGTCYKNETCQVGCKLNTWGPDCSQTCNVNCEDAPDNTTFICGRDGVCKYGCKMTFMGPKCSDSCPANCINNHCNATSGYCLQGCEKDYWGDICDTNCSTNCLQSSETTCYQDDGTCVQGCVEDHYGPFCGQGCPANCLNDTCQRDNGTCSLGCTKGFTGEYCNLTITPSTEPPVTDPVVIAATAGASGGGLIALVIVALILRHRYVAYKEDAEKREANRKTKGDLDDLKKKRMDKRKSRLPMVIFNPHFDPVSVPKTEDEDDSVLAVDGLLDHVMNNNIEGFSEEYKKLPENVIKPAKQRKKSSNKGSQKVKWSTAGDNGPVDIEKIVIDNMLNESTERSYNASLIKLYSRKYIAAEGPSSSTSVDFWLTVWSNPSPVIIMLTPTSINKHSSSIRYWPEIGKTTIYGNIKITNVKEETFANFVSRELKIEKDNETRDIQQLQLYLWADDKKFPNIADLIDFYVYFRSITTADPEPVLVHCSDGEGRTGVFIALDLLVRDGEKFQKISVPDCVKSLREQRDNMVLTQEHYKFVYSLVAQTLQLRCKPVREKDFVESYKKNNEALESNPLLTATEDAYENMRAAIVMKPVDVESVKRQWNLKMKNRDGADIPEDQYRPSLPGGLYINAVYIDTLHKKDLITTQMPLPKTVEDFYKLVAAEKCHVIVMLNSTKSKDKSLGVYWPKKEKTTVKHGDICTTLDDTTKTEDYKQLGLTLSDYSGKSCCQRKLTEGEHHVSLFQLKHWETGPRPSNTVAMLRLIQSVKAERQKYEDGPIVVHCLNGSERSGIFCALYELTDAIERGLAFSVINTVYKIKYRRPSAILNLDQYKFIHEALEIFITSEEFRGEPVQTEAPMIQADEEN